MAGGISIERGGYGSPEALSKHSRARIEVCRLIFAVVDYDPFRIADLRTPSLDRELIRCRRAVVLAAKLHTNAAFSEIGRALCRDHSSITRGLDAALILYREDDEFVELCARIAERAVLRGRWREAGGQQALALPVAPPITAPVPPQPLLDFSRGVAS
ncbi:hypothetical protein DAH66_12740 [Sphingomonas koreensis]|uniref:Chromosomal replication initiator DnaA C-terminal domain-containing protein n=1 Tax=Sphingomonas koreensis TaxID=93064 RepID=A0A430G2D5_9SPHN|nr:hypothetical protein [Sphingomonas koreensis]RSY83130.1 hypothetical protein DAH66_12740 [Sphingomonas koreensis]